MSKLFDISFANNVCPFPLLLRPVYYSKNIAKIASIYPISYIYFIRFVFIPKYFLKIEIAFAVFYNEIKFVKFVFLNYLALT